MKTSAILLSVLFLTVLSCSKNKPTDPINPHNISGDYTVNVYSSYQLPATSPSDSTIFSDTTYMADLKINYNSDTITLMLNGTTHQQLTYNKTVGDTLFFRHPHPFYPMPMEMRFNTNNNKFIYEASYPTNHSGNTYLRITD